MGVQIISPSLDPSLHVGGNLISNGLEPYNRLCSTQGMSIGTGTSGDMGLYYGTALSTTTVTKINWCLADTVAAATPTLSRVGIYEIASNGNGTLVASTPNDTALFTSAAFTIGTKNLSSSYTVVKGRRYAIAFLCVSGAAMPVFYGSIATADSAVGGLDPRITGYIPGQADLPASFAAGTVSNIFRAVWCAALP